MSSNVGKPWIASQNLESPTRDSTGLQLASDTPRKSTNRASDLPLGSFEDIADEANDDAERSIQLIGYALLAVTLALGAWVLLVVQPWR